MLTQGIKRWLQSLFAWWPWNRVEEMDYAQATDSLNRGIAQETMFRTAADGPLTQPTQQNIITISIEPLQDEEIVEWPPFENRERTAPFTPPIASVPPEETEEVLLFGEFFGNQQALADSRTFQEKTTELHATAESLEPTTQQRLEFLRYLIQRGIVSDDIP